MADQPKAGDTVIIACQVLGTEKDFVNVESFKNKPISALNFRRVPNSNRLWVMAGLSSTDDERTK